MPRVWIGDRPSRHPKVMARGHAQGSIYGGARGRERLGLGARACAIVRPKCQSLCIREFASTMEIVRQRFVIFPDVNRWRPNTDHAIRRYEVTRFPTPNCW